MSHYSSNKNHAARRIFLRTLTPFLFLSEGSSNVDPSYFGQVSPIDTVVIAAMSSELEAVKNVVNKCSNAKGYIAGVGKVLSAMNATRYILYHKLERVILIGLVGGLEQNLKIGDIVVSSSTIIHGYGFLSENELTTRSIETIPELGVGTGQKSIFIRSAKAKDQPRDEKSRCRSSRIFRASDKIKRAQDSQDYFWPLTQQGINL
ncbi:MAG: hypothetical protein GDA40_06270 [Rhodobacteraceae bacterium]|nr:hypothetical protein [Paracoccaceae bacterium]